jgi:putative oxidoreductase
MRNFFQKPDLGLLLLRVLVGLLMFGNGIKVFMAGRMSWEFMGQQMSIFGITAYPMFWGLAAAVTYVLGGLLFAIGAFFRWACFFLLCTMVVAAMYHLKGGHDFFKEMGYSYTLGSIFLSMMFVGPGSFSLSKE